MCGSTGDGSQFQGSRSEAPFPLVVVVHPGHGQAERNAAEHGGGHTVTFDQCVGRRHRADRHPEARPEHRPTLGE